MDKTNFYIDKFRKEFDEHWRHLTSIGCNDLPDDAKESVYYFAKWGFDKAHIDMNQLKIKDWSV